MIIIPYSTALDLGRRPYVTIGIICLCVAIQWLADRRYNVVATQIEQFCARIYVPEPRRSTVGFLEGSDEACEYLLESRHDFADEQAFRHSLTAYNDESETFTATEMAELIAETERNYDKLAMALPAYLQNLMAQYPPSLNPVPMLASSFAHIDWWHTTGNLVFFYAFAASVEVVIGPLLFTAAIVLLSLFCGVAYSLFCYFATGCPPTVGLSGVVMGVIGMAAFLMPRARVNTVMLHGLLGWRFSFPAWALAVFFISVDLLDLFGGGMEDSSVNFLSHVAGGIGGYLGALLLLGKLRERTRDDVNDAIEISAINRGPNQGSLAREPISRRQLTNTLREEAARKTKETFSRELYRFVRVENSARAQLLLLKDYDLWSLSPEIYEDLFYEVGAIKRGRSWLCLGRLCIHLYMRMGRYGRAVAIAEQLAASYPRLELASPTEALAMAHEAMTMNREALALTLLGDPASRYGGHLNQADAARLIAGLDDHNNTCAAPNPETS